MSVIKTLEHSSSARLFSSEIKSMQPSDRILAARMTATPHCVRLRNQGGGPCRHTQINVTFLCPIEPVHEESVTVKLASYQVFDPSCRHPRYRVGPNDQSLETHCRLRRIVCARCVQVLLRTSSARDRRVRALTATPGGWLVLSQCREILGLGELRGKMYI